MNSSFMMFIVTEYAVIGEKGHMNLPSVMILLLVVDRLVQRKQKPLLLLE